MENCYNDMNDKISIIIPVYNVEKFVIRCLESVYEQTYKDLEVIIVDDCSPDKSVELAVKFIEEHDLCKSFKLVRHSKNQGLSAARNTGIKKSSGEYIFFLDSDDCITEDCIKQLHDHMQPDIDYVMSIYEIIEKGNKICTDFSFNEGVNTQSDLLKCYISRSLPWNAVNRLIRRKFIIDNRLYFTPGITAEDLLWNFELLIKVNKVFLLNKVTYKYIRNEDSIMGEAKRTTRNQEDLILISERLKDYCINDTSCSMLQMYYNVIKYDFIPENICWASQRFKTRFCLLKANYKPQFKGFSKCMSFKSKLFFLLPSYIKAIMKIIYFTMVTYNKILVCKFTKRISICH